MTGPDRMTGPERAIWIATFAAAYNAAIDRMKRGDVELCEDIAASAATLASEALCALRDVHRKGNERLSLAAAKDLDCVLGEAEQAEADEMFKVATRIILEVRLSSADEESRWRDEVSGRCHVWGDFYGPATSRHLARALAHRFMDRQGGDLQHMRDALAKYRARDVSSPT